MNMSELDEIIAQNTDITFCPICGTPFRKYHKRQKTCATEECKGKWRAIYSKARTMRLKDADIEAFRKYHADAQHKSRQKKKKLASLNESYEILEDYWDKKHNRHVDTDGLDYGKKQMERTLASVPKIDVSGFLKESSE